jgi:hypothetical protein
MTETLLGNKLRLGILIFLYCPPLFLERQNNYRVAVLMFAAQDNYKIKSQLNTSLNIGLDPILLLAGYQNKNLNHLWVYCKYCQHQDLIPVAGLTRYSQGC